MSEQTISVPETVVRKLEDRASAVDYGSADEYATFVLEEVLHNLEENEQSIDEAEVEDRLEALGYVE